MKLSDVRMPFQMSERDKKRVRACASENYWRGQKRRVEKALKDPKVLDLLSLLGLVTRKP